MRAARGVGLRRLEFRERTHEASDDDRVLIVPRERSLSGLLRGTTVVDFENQSAYASLMRQLTTSTRLLNFIAAPNARLLRLRPV